MNLQAVEKVKYSADKASELQRLRDRVEELEGILGISDASHWVLLGLSPTEARILGLLVKKTFASTETIYVSGWGHRLECDQPEINSVAVYICKLNARLARFGIRVRNAKGSGYFLGAADKVALQSALEAEMA